MAEGRCLLSSYATGDSPNNKGVCSPAHAVRWYETETGLDARLNGILIDRYATGEAAAYPTLCKGRFDVEGQADYAIEEPASLNALRSEEHTSELQSLMRISYAVFCLKKKNQATQQTNKH